MFFVHPLLVLMKLALSIYKLTILDSTEIIFTFQIYVVKQQIILQLP